MASRPAAFAWKSSSCTAFSLTGTISRMACVCVCVRHIIYSFSLTIWLDIQFLLQYIFQLLLNLHHEGLWSTTLFNKLSLQNHLRICLIIGKTYMFGLSKWSYTAYTNACKNILHWFIIKHSVDTESRQTHSNALERTARSSKRSTPAASLRRPVRPVMRTS